MFVDSSEFTKYIILICESLLVVVLAVIFFFLKEKTAFKKLGYTYQQVIIGVVFGAASIFGTEMGVNMYSSVANVRDAAPLVAGLIFGGPAGVIAGFIGAVERILYTMVFHDMDGEFSMVACVIATFLCGIYAWVLRKWFFEKKTPNWLFGFATAAIMEVIHFIILYLAHIRDPQTVLTIIKNLAIPMILGNGVGVGVACLAVRLLEREITPEKLLSKKGSINNKVLLGLLILILSTSVVSTAFVVTIQNNTAYEDANYALTVNASDAAGFLFNASDTIAGNVAHKAADDYYNDPNGNEKLLELKEKYGATALSIVAMRDGEGYKEGEIIYSTKESEISYNINAYEDIDEAYSYVHDSILYYGECGKYFNYSERFGESIKTAAFVVGPYDEAAEYYLVLNLNVHDFYHLPIYGDEEADVESLSEQSDTFTRYRRVYLSGYIIIFDAYGEIVSDESERYPDDAGITLEDLKDKNSYERYAGVIYGTKCFYMLTRVETYTVCIVVPQKDVNDNRDMMIVIYSFMMATFSASIFFVSYILVKNIIIRNIRKINDTLSLIMAGDLDQKVKVNSSIEFEDLSHDINVTVGVLKDYIKEAEERIDKELAFAKTIQTSVLPSAFPAFPGVKEFDIYATMDTAKEVGGDFYDFYYIDNSHVAFLVADVSGKGIPASMFMMESKALIKNSFTNIHNVAEVFSNVNESLVQGNDANMFITAWMGVIDLKTGEVQFVNAGHNTPALYNSSEGKWEYIKESRDVVLAIMKDSEYHIQTLKLNPGDKLYLYTDGVTESTNKDKALYGEERLLKYLNKAKKHDIYKLLPGIQKDIDNFVGDSDQFDDITMLVIEYKGK